MPVLQERSIRAAGSHDQVDNGGLRTELLGIESDIFSRPLFADCDAYWYIASFAATQQYVGYRGIADLASRPSGRGSRHLAARSDR